MEVESGESDEKKVFKKKPGEISRGCGSGGNKSRNLENRTGVNKGWILKTLCSIGVHCL